jgi:DNA replication protein DnaC
MADEKLEATPAKQACSDFMRDRTGAPWLVLSGPPGCGKSLAAANALWWCDGRWVRADELLRLFASMFGDQYEQQQTLRDARLLVIDDVGCELDAQRMLPALLDLLDARKSARNTPTILTTNLNKKQFAERYANDRLTSRMHESVQWVGLSNGDMRRK